MVVPTKREIEQHNLVNINIYKWNYTFLICGVVRRKPNGLWIDNSGYNLFFILHEKAKTAPASWKKALSFFLLH
jgi:hypothetical protein